MSAPVPQSPQAPRADGGTKSGQRAGVGSRGREGTPRAAMAAATLTRCRRPGPRGRGGLLRKAAAVELVVGSGPRQRSGPGPPRPARSLGQVSVSCRMAPSRAAAGGGLDHRHDPGADRLGQSAPGIDDGGQV